MYILAKQIEGVNGITIHGFTIHGITDNDKVAEAWYAASGSVFDTDVDNIITVLPLDPVDFDQPETSEE